MRGNQHQSTWLPEEDAALRALVSAMGKGNWRNIAAALETGYGFGGRIGRQCRERFVHHLDESITKRPWTEEEEAQLVRLVDKLGGKWSAIAKTMAGRSDNDVKNHYNAMKKRDPARELHR